MDSRLMEQLVAALNSNAKGIAQGHVAALGGDVVNHGESTSLIDAGREWRTGVPEVILGSHKTAEQIAHLLVALTEKCGCALATRVDQAKAEQVLALLGGAAAHVRHHRAACTMAIGRANVVAAGSKLAIVCAGTSDFAVAAEAVEVAEFLGFAVTAISDVGVAGLGRLLARIGEIRECEIAIACAGMEGALPSVIAGLVDIPVIAVPTSVGYGVSAGGYAALISMLSSCAPGIVVVNIDNGFGAVAAAAKMVGKRT